MLIAMTANLFPFGPDKCYGGERVIYYLIRGLHALGHRIVLFADAGTSVESKYLYDRVVTPPFMASQHDPYFVAAVKWEKDHGETFNVFQSNYFGDVWEWGATKRWPYVELTWCNWCHMMHGYGEKKPFNIISTCKFHQYVMLNSSRIATTPIYYGLPLDDYKFNAHPSDYVVWLGRCDPCKAPDLAVKVAKKAGKKLVILGPVHEFENFMKHPADKPMCELIDDTEVIWLRGASDKVKNEVLRNAFCLISTNHRTRSELFGLINIEALACGTPVLAWSWEGAMSAVEFDHVIDAGVNKGRGGRLMRLRTELTDDEVADVAAEVLVNEIPKVDRADCRRLVEERFSLDLMARRFEWFYQQIQNKEKHAMLEVPF